MPEEEITQKLNEYLERTGQSRQYLFGGSIAFGFTFILNELLPKALHENKKIVWKDEFEKGIDAMSYSLEEI